MLQKAANGSCIIVSESGARPSDIQIIHIAIATIVTPDTILRWHCIHDEH